MVLVLWRPKGLNEAIPTTLGAILILISGSVTLTDLGDISSKVTGAAITIIATMIMAISLESFGFFHWVASQLLRKSRGSGIRLFWLTNLLCFLMTVFINNDGSILITTPILLLLLKYLRFKKHEMLPYLISGALIATASSAPIGVSNIVNLISLEIIGMDLYLHTAMMFVPGVLGLLFLSSLLFLVFYKDLPRTLNIPSHHRQMDFTKKHPLQSESELSSSMQNNKLMVLVIVFVFLVRIGLFVASYLNFPVSIVAVIGSVILLGWRWIYLRLNPLDVLVKTPWHIFVFAFNMYVVIYGLHNIGLTDFLVSNLEPMLDDNLFHASITMGTILTILSNLFNNHPALMVGTLTLTEMNLDPIILKTIYLANIIGSDIGSLLLPIGTLATLIWMHILRKAKVKISWKQYIRVTAITIPPTVLFTLLCLYFWIRFVFGQGF
ncbi:MULTISPECIES: arsenic transporter [unclassified Bacillus (in: firmicutes)]|uniref:arsenic transporter n=1 Tax=unclassified Bacillus (in: firmicutes) TaxID=185979 RepID=UPI0008EEEB2A|nr:MULTISPECIES: arsenic transporter [unclassified Bacillus (in: firmicutes)]SFA71944.1 arsenite efflux membrane protein ArsB [Bacillus sp. UNCCL13]